MDSKRVAFDGIDFNKVLSPEENPDFSSAFNRARELNLRDFTWQGASYSTEVQSQETGSEKTKDLLSLGGLGTK